MLAQLQSPEPMIEVGSQCATFWCRDQCHLDCLHDGYLLFLVNDGNEDLLMKHEKEVLTVQGQMKVLLSTRESVVRDLAPGYHVELGLAQLPPAASSRHLPLRMDFDQTVP